MRKSRKIQIEMKRALLIKKKKTNQKRPNRDSHRSADLCRNKS